MLTHDSLSYTKSEERSYNLLANGVHNWSFLILAAAYISAGRWSRKEAVTESPCRQSTSRKSPFVITAWSLAVSDTVPNALHTGHANAKGLSSQQASSWLNKKSSNHAIHWPIDF